MAHNQIKSAQDVLMAYWDGSVPIPVERLIQQLGIRLVITNEPEQLRCYGSIDQIDGQWRIINRANKPVAQRWLLAHQLGHIILNHWSTDQLPCYETPTSFRLSNSSQREREANAFASQLLIPENVTDYAITHHKYTTLQSLADLFGVSEVAMRARLIDLGITE